MKFIIYSRYQGTRYDMSLVKSEDRGDYKTDWSMSTIEDSWYINKSNGFLSIDKFKEYENNFNIPNWAMQNFIKCLFDGDSDV